MKRNAGEQYMTDKRKPVPGKLPPPEVRWNAKSTDIVYNNVFVIFMTVCREMHYYYLKLCQIIPNSKHIKEINLINNRISYYNKTYVINNIIANVLYIVLFLGRACRCQLQCGEIEFEDKVSLFEEFYKLDYNALTFFLKEVCLVVGDVKRRRVCENRSNRRFTMQYNIKIKTKESVYKVCQKT